MNCPRCGRQMVNHGSTILTSHPPQWDETWCCHECRVKRSVRVIDNTPSFDIRNYETIKETT